MTFGQIHGASWLAGIGFTMSLFIAGLAFGAQEGQLTAAKVGILGGSAVAAAIGSTILVKTGRA